MKILKFLEIEPRFAGFNRFDSGISREFNTRYKSKESGSPTYSPTYFRFSSSNLHRQPWPDPTRRGEGSCEDFERIQFWRNYFGKGFGAFGDSYRESKTVFVMDRKISSFQDENYQTKSQLFSFSKYGDFKGSSDPSHFIFEINFGMKRIRHWTTLNSFLDRLKIDWRWRYSNSESFFVGSASFRHRFQK